jgi:hypothetical protein
VHQTISRGKSPLPVAAEAVGESPADTSNRAESDQSNRGKLPSREANGHR